MHRVPAAIREVRLDTLGIVVVTPWSGGAWDKEPTTLARGLDVGVEHRSVHRHRVVVVILVAGEEFGVGAATLSGAAVASHHVSIVADFIFGPHKTVATGGREAGVDAVIGVDVVAIVALFFVRVDE